MRPHPLRISLTPLRSSFSGVFLVSLCLTSVVSAQSASLSSADDSTQQKVSALVHELERVRSPQTVAISPDGNYVAWTYNGNRGSELHLTGLAPVGFQDGAWDRVISPDTIGDVTNLQPGSCTASHPAWSPNGKHLAFLSDCNDSDGRLQPGSQQNIYVWTEDDNGMKQVSHLKGEISDLIWSPDGKAIGFLFVENATRRAGALAAMKPWGGVYGEDNVEVQRVAAVDLATGKAGWISADPKLHVYEFSWAPNSRQIAYVAAAPPGENNWWVARLYKQSVNRGPCFLWESIEGENTPAACSEAIGVGSSILLDPQKIAGPLHGLQIAVPRFSPDGKTIAFIGGLMSDQGSIGGDIYLIPSTGGQPHDLTPNRPASPAWITWLDDKTLGVSEHVGGSSHLTAINTVTGKDDPSIDLTIPGTIIAGMDVMSVSTSDTDNIALIRQSFEHPPEVWVGPLSHLKQLSHLNDALKPAWGKAESIEYENEGFHVQGWLLYPANYDPSKKYPLLVSVHGGPSSAAMPRWPTASYGPVPFSALGYFVFEPNPRGSFGQGERFTQANVKDFGYGDLRDILAGVDVLEKRFPIDKNREGITGWSYGGFMTMFAVTQTTRFKAAVAGAGISDWKSYYGENSIDQWMIPFFGASVYDVPAVYARSSPINFIKKAKTPTLLLVGDRDGECPAPQSLEFWHALRDEGVKTRLVIYPNEGHHISNPDHQRDVLQRALNWFTTEMPPQ